MSRSLTVVVAVVASTLIAATARPADSPRTLRAAWVNGGRLHATFKLPAGMIPYQLVFYGPGAGPNYVNAFLGPYSDIALLWKTGLVATKVTTGALFGQPGTYSGWLNYGRPDACVANPSTKSDIQISRCPHRRSNVVRMKVGDIIGPGALVASSGSSGAYAIASAVGSVKYPQDALIRVTSSPAQSAHVAWSATCSRGFQVAGRSGSYDIDTPDSTPIDLPLDSDFLNPPDSCTISVTAQLDDTGTLNIQVYSHTGK